jgi:hypothetical protein
MSSDSNWWDSWDTGDTIGAAATLGAGYMASQAARESTDAQTQAADLAWQRSQPWNVGGVFGATTFDPESRTSLQTLAPGMQTEYDAAMASSAANRGQVASMGVDPTAMGKQFYEQQKALYAPEQAQQRQERENRLYAQGMFGSTGGGVQMNALLDAQAQQDAQAKIAGFDKAQALLDTYRGRQAGDLAMAQNLGNLPAMYSQTGMGIGSNLSSMASTAANMQSSAAKQMSDATAGMWGGLATGIDKYQNSANYAYQAPKK